MPVQATTSPAAAIAAATAAISASLLGATKNPPSAWQCADAPAKFCTHSSLAARFSSVSHLTVVSPPGSLPLTSVVIIGMSGGGGDGGGGDGGGEGGGEGGGDGGGGGMLGGVT